MSEAARFTPTVSSSEDPTNDQMDEDRNTAFQGRPEPHRREWSVTAEHAWMPMSFRDGVRETLDLHALAWVDAFRDHGLSVCFEKVRDQVSKGDDQVMPAFLSDELLQTVGRKLQAHRDRILEMRYMTHVTAGQSGLE